MSMRREFTAITIVALLVGTPLTAFSAAGASSGAVYTTTSDGTAVNANIYGSTDDAYLSGGPQNLNASGLPLSNHRIQAELFSEQSAPSTDRLVDPVAKYTSTATLTDRIRIAGTTTTSVLPDE